MKKEHALTGIIAAFGVALTSGVAYPFVKYLDQFSIEELAFARGLCAALFVGAIWLRHLRKPDKNTLIYALFFSLAIYGGYRSARDWGVQMSVVVMTTWPLWCSLLEWRRGGHVSRWTVLSSLLLLVGVTFGLSPWENEVLTWSGAIWPVVMMIGAVVGSEQAKKSQDHWSLRVVCLGVVLMLTAAASAVIYDSSFFDKGLRISLTDLGWLVAFGSAAGIGYFLVINIAIDNLPTHKAILVSMVEAPVMIILAGVLVDESMTWLQWSGVALAIIPPVAFGFFEATRTQGDVPPQHAEQV